MVNKNRLVTLFCELVQIDSESGHEGPIRDRLITMLTQLGLTIKVDKKGNLIARLKGNRAKPTLLLSAHMDTVVPGKGIIPVIKGNKITSKGKTVLGGDDKSGVAEIIECLTIIREKKLSHPPLLVAFSVEEETGVQGVRAMKGIHADFGFCLDTDGPIGTITTSAPSHERFIATVHGKAAHAGIEPEKGIHTIQAACAAIAKLKIGRIDDETVANIGIISGGKATNIIPDEVIVRGEARSRNEQKLKKQIEHMKKTFEDEITKRKATVQFQITREYNRFDITQEKPLISLCRKAAKTVGITINLKATGGGSDANYFNQFGIPTAVISSGMSKVHTTEEEIAISDMVKATEFLLAIIQNA